MLRYIVISALLVAGHVRAQAGDVDAITAEWIKQIFTENNQNNKDQRNDLTANDVNTVVDWVKDVIPTSSETTPNNTKKKVNLDPYNIVIKNSSLSLPAGPTNKFSDEINTTPSPETPCTSEDGIKGVCVLYYLCDVTTRKVIGDGTNLIDVRFGSNTTGRDCPHYLDICCQLEDRVDPPQAEKKTKPVALHPPISNDFITSAENSQLDDRVDSPQAEKKTRPVALHQPIRDDFITSVTNLAPDSFDVEPKFQQQCGWNSPELFVFQPPNQDVADRGVYANYGDFPWMVALLRKSGTKVWVQNNYVGGGSLIHPSVVMTAFHKLLKVKAEELKCRAGEWDTQTEKEQYGIQEQDADRIVSHPGFDKTSLLNDVALIFLKKPFDLANAPHIGTACLAPVLPDKATCFAMGWGKDAQSEEYVHILKKLRLPLVEHKRCETLLHTNTRFRLIPQFVLHESLTCAGGEENVDTCQGDGGASLVCPVGHHGGRTRYAVVGMVAYGLACGQKDVPGVYVNVPHLYPWVQQQMTANGYTNDTYSY